MPVPLTTGQGTSFSDRVIDQENDVDMVPDDRADIVAAAGSGPGSSVFRWALESMVLRMGEELPEPQQSVGKGSFSTTPETPFIQLPVAQGILRKMSEVNRSLAAKVEPSKTEGWFPPMTVSSDQQRTFATKPTGADSLTCGSPSEDRLLGALRKQPAPVWSAYVKKARLIQWQSASHQLLGQLSMIDGLTKFVGDLVSESSMLAAERDQVLGALDVLKSTVTASERLGTSLAAHLDLTARDAELRLLEITPFQQAMFRASPLFSGELFGGITRSTVEDITSSRMMADIHSIAQKGGTKGASSSSKGKKVTPKEADQPSRAAQPFQGQAAVPKSGQQPRATKKAGKGGKGKNKSKK